MKINNSTWLNKCISWKEKWPIHLEKQESDETSVNIYELLKYLTENTNENTAFISDAGSAFYACSQGLKLKKGQTYITSGGQAEMGFSICAAIGAAFSSPNKNIIALTGDGSFQFNIQELQTIKEYGLPIKLFILNNNGYLSIKTTLNKFYGGNLKGVNPSTGVSFPNIEKIAYAYDIKYEKINNKSEFNKINLILGVNYPIIAEVICMENQQIIPTIGAKKDDNGKMVSYPLYDMMPFLSKEEIEKEMIHE